jgi:hypothetical protein
MQNASAFGHFEAGAGREKVVPDRRFELLTPSLRNTADRDTEGLRSSHFNSFGAFEFVSILPVPCPYGANLGQFQLSFNVCFHRKRPLTGCQPTVC